MHPARIITPIFLYDSWHSYCATHFYKTCSSNSSCITCRYFKESTIIYFFSHYFNASLLFCENCQSVYANPFLCKNKFIIFAFTKLSPYFSPAFVPTATAMPSCNTATTAIFCTDMIQHTFNSYAFRNSRLNLY